MQGRSEAWSAVNNIQTARILSGPVEAATAPKFSRLTLTLKQAIDDLVPSTYSLDIAEDLSLNTFIHIDTSKNWLEALGQGLSEANIEFVANLYSKSATIKWNKIALAQVIKTYLPEDFTVFSDAGIDLQSLVRFDTRQYWAEALSLGTRDNGIALTINYENKIISLRPAHLPVQSTDKPGIKRNPAAFQSPMQSLATF